MRFPDDCPFCGHVRNGDGICQCPPGCPSCPDGCCGQVNTAALPVVEHLTAGHLAAITIEP